MKDYLNIGPVPPEEDCAQLGTPDYREKAIAECRRYIKLLREMLGEEPVGAQLAIKWFQHDFGSYCEVVCYYDNERPETLDYALKCEGDGPLTWKGGARNDERKVSSG